MSQYLALVKQLSRTACALNDTFGLDEEGSSSLWVRRGCRGRFRCGPHSHSPVVSCGYQLANGRESHCSCSTHPEPMPMTTAKPVTSTRRCAVCITGLQRTLVDLPVVTSYGRSIRLPLQQAGWAVDAHIVVSAPSGTDHGPRGGSSSVRPELELRRRIKEAYQARSVTLLPPGAATRWVTQPRNAQCAIDGAAARWRNPETGDARHYSVLLQHVATGVCYDEVKAAEARDGARYDWIVRVRTDLVHFAPVPLAVATPPLSERHVHVPVNGMSGAPAYRCMNDHALLCPRKLCGRAGVQTAVARSRPWPHSLGHHSARAPPLHHVSPACWLRPQHACPPAPCLVWPLACRPPACRCRPYFRLLELWTSPHCRAATTATTAAATTDGIFLSNASLHGAPSAPYVLPRPPPASGSAAGAAASEQLGGQWYAFARYATNASRGGAPCGAREESAACCGALREVAWPSAIARSHEEGLQCRDRLVRDVPSRRAPDAPLRPWWGGVGAAPAAASEVGVYLRRCASLQAAWQWGALRLRAGEEEDPYWRDRDAGGADAVRVAT